MDSGRLLKKNIRPQQWGNDILPHFQPPPLSCAFLNQKWVMLPLFKTAWQNFFPSRSFLLLSWIYYVNFIYTKHPATRRTLSFTHTNGLLSSALALVLWLFYWKRKWIINVHLLFMCHSRSLRRHLNYQYQLPKVPVCLAVLNGYNLEKPQRSSNC